MISLLLLSISLLPACNRFRSSATKPPSSPVANAPAKSAQPSAPQQGSAAKASAPAPSAAELAAMAPPKWAPVPENLFVDISWIFNAINFPGSVDVFEVPSDFAFDTGETGVVKIGEPLPFLRKLTMPLHVRARSQVTFALAIKNETNEPWYFFANFHNQLPSENGNGVTLQCLCTNRIFELPPKSVWYRVVSMKVAIARPRQATTIRHDIVGLTRQQIRERGLENNIVHPGDNERD